MVYESNGTEEIKKLFEGWQETMIWSCMQGVMGHLYAENNEKPSSAMAMLGDFCFFAGEPNEELVSYKPQRSTQSFMIMTAKTPDWFPVIEAVYGRRAKRVSRYAMRKEPDVFDRAVLRKLVGNLDKEFRLQMIDERIFNDCRKYDWSRDFISLFSNYDEYKKLGLGVVALKGDIPVAGASSYSVYKGGIEIEIDTSPEYRRRGLATACGARLIIECLDRGLYPSWDAQNVWSVALAEKLGYHFDYEYTAYEISDY